MTAEKPTTHMNPPYSLRQLVGYMLGLGTWGFGGSVALVGYVHRGLVERRAWILETEYKEGMTLAQLMPGPLAAQLAIYIGFVHHGVRGATLAGIAFVLPSFLMVLVIGMADVNYGGLPWMQAVFYGVGACVFGIIATSACTLIFKSVRSDKLLWATYALSASLTVFRNRKVSFYFWARACWSGGRAWAPNPRQEDDCSA